MLANSLFERKGSRLFVFAALLLFAQVASASTQVQNANGHWFTQPSDAEVLERWPQMWGIGNMPQNITHSGQVFNWPITEIEVGRTYRLSDIFRNSVTIVGGTFALSFCGLNASTMAPVGGGREEMFVVMGPAYPQWTDDWGLLASVMLGNTRRALEQSTIRYSLSAIDNCTGRNVLWVVDPQRGIADKSDIRFVPNSGGSGDLASTPSGIVRAIDINEIRDVQDTCNMMDIAQLRRTRSTLIGSAVVSGIGAVTGLVATGANIHGAISGRNQDEESEQSDTAGSGGGFQAGANVVAAGAGAAAGTAATVMTGISANQLGDIIEQMEACQRAIRGL